MRDNPVIGAIQCAVCHDVILSRHRHDYRSCSCGHSSIDGGRDYMKVVFQPGRQPHAFKLELTGGLTTGALQLDENRHLGLIKTKKIVYHLLYRYTLNQKGKFYRYPKGLK